MSFLHRVMCASTLLALAACAETAVDEPQPIAPTPSVSYSQFFVEAGKWYGPNGLSAARLAAPSSYSRSTRFVLERTPGPWSLSSKADAAASIPPDPFKAYAQNCVRDQYISAAMIGGYGVESNARKGDLNLAAQFANTMNSSLRSAYALCDFSGRPPAGNVNCSTQRDMTCDELRALLG